MPEQRVCSGCGKPHPTPMVHTFNKYGYPVWWHDRCWKEQLMYWFGYEYIPNHYEQEQPQNG